MNHNQPQKIKELAAKAEFFGLHKNIQLPEEHEEILISANKEKRLLSAQELKVLCNRSHSDANKLEELQAKLPELINEAKRILLKRIPNITEPGGSLYPKERAEACWRDCFHFARISIYGTAAGETNITDKQGLKVVQELYSILEVPINALIICLKELQLKCSETYTINHPKKGISLLDGCFNHLVEKMEAMQ